MTFGKANIFEPVVGDVFARLILSNLLAKKGFSEVVNHIRADASSKNIPPADYIRAEPDTEKLTLGCGFTKPDVDDHNQRVETGDAWTGAYIFSLKSGPRAGPDWVLGSENGQGWTSNIDLVLQINENQDAPSKHAYFSFHPESRRFKLTALRATSVSGLLGGGPPLQKGASRALEDEDVIATGLLTYSYELTDFGKSDQFDSDVMKFLDVSFPPTTVHHAMRGVPPTPGGVTLGKFKCTHGVFLKGSSGEIFGGSNMRGDVVAIKRHRFTEKERLKKHQMLLQGFGRHVSSTLYFRKEYD